MTEPSAAQWVAETRFSGVIAALRLARNAVAPLLPPELRLGGGSSRERTARLVVAFGDHAASTVHAGAMQVRTGVSFREVFFGVPCVVAATGAPALFVPLMYCDELVSTWSGNALYGFNKQSATMEWLGGSFVVTVGGHEPLILQVAGGVRSRVDPHALAAPARLPVLGRRRDGSYARCSFEWGLTGIRPRPRMLLASFRGSCMPTLGGAEVSTSAAMAVSALPWRISWPETCRLAGGDGPPRPLDVTLAPAPTPAAPR